MAVRRAVCLCSETGAGALCCYGMCHFIPTGMYNVDSTAFHFSGLFGRTIFQHASKLWRDSAHGACEVTKLVVLSLFILDKIPVRSSTVFDFD